MFEYGVKAWKVKNSENVPPKSARKPAAVPAAEARLPVTSQRQRPKSHPTPGSEYWCAPIEIPARRDAGSRAGPRLGHRAPTTLSSCSAAIRLANPAGLGRVEKGDVSTDVKCKTFGCGAAVATSSMLTEMVVGKSLREAADVSNVAVAEALGGLPPKKMHCSNLAADALQAAIRDYLLRSGREAEIDEILASPPKAPEPSSH